MLRKLRTGAETLRRDWTKLTNFRTEADLLVNTVALEEIRKAFPEYSVYSEELDEVKACSDVTVVIDPIDGTIPFVSGISDHYTFAVALLNGDELGASVVYWPEREVAWLAEAGKGSWCCSFAKGETYRLQTSVEQNRNHALWVVDVGKTGRGDILELERALLHDDDGVGTTFRSDCASYLMARIAEGKLHGYTHLNIPLEDAAPGALLVKEAGGEICTIDGRPWKRGELTLVACANHSLCRDVLDYLQSSQIR